MSELPSNWITAPLSELADDSHQYVPQEQESFLYIDISAIDRASKSIQAPQRLLGRDAPSRARKKVATGDTLVSMTRPSLNAVALVPPTLDGQIASTGFDVLRPQPGIDPRWLAYTVRTDKFVTAMSDLVQGALYPAVRSKDVRSFIAPVAPAAEQTRIADQLDTLLARIQACQDRLDAIPALLKRFRQAVLDAAMTGQLTDEARASKQRVFDAEHLLLTRLNAEKPSGRNKLQAFLLNHPPQPPGPDLPRAWMRTYVGAVGTVSNGSTPSRGVAEYWRGDIPWVSSGEVANREIRHTREAITNAGFENSSVRLLPEGTVLIAMIGEGKTRGQSALLKIPACINQNVAGVVPVPELLDSKYLWFWFQRQYETTRTKGNGSGPKALNCERVRELEIFLPPIDEQAEIVRRVEALFKLADRIEARHAAARAQAQRLSPLTLAKAFRGELVPQDAKDEPASQLLQRIAEAQATAAKAAPRGRPRSKSKPDSPAVQPAAPPALPALPDWSALPAGAWADHGTPQDEHLVAAQLTAVLKAWGRPMPQEQARLAALLCLQPRLCTAALPAGQAQQWRRLVGAAAEPLPAQVTAFQPAVNMPWRRALAGMRARGDLLESGAGAQSTWALGPGAAGVDTSGWPDGRAAWIVAYLRAHGVESLLPSLAAPVLDFVHARAA